MHSVPLCAQSHQAHFARGFATRLVTVPRVIHALRLQRRDNIRRAYAEPLAAMCDRCRAATARKGQS